MKRFASIIAVAVVALSVAFVPFGDVSAQSSAALSIVPKKNYTIEPGKSIRDTLTIRNLDSERTLDLNLSIVDFTFKDDGGTPDLRLAQDAPQTAWSIKPFVKIPKTVKIPPRGSQTLDMSMTVPKGQGAGSYYSAIVYSSGNPEGGNVGLSASGVTLVFANVPGTVKEDLELKKFGIYNQASGNSKAKYTNFSINMPENIAYTLENKGDVAESPVGTITLRHMFGAEYKVDDINSQDSLALIGQTRTFVTCVAPKTASDNGAEIRSNEVGSCEKPSLLPGFYTASIDAYYGWNGNTTKELVGTTWFIYAPLWFIILVIVIILAIAFAIWNIVSKSKKKRRGARAKKSAALRR